MKNIHLLPTNKPSRLYYNLGGALLFKSYENHNGVNIYITNDEEIKEGDWIICSMSVAPTKALKNENYLFSNAWRKIILTTDKELINNGVQAIDDEFLEWFVKNPSCELVDVYNDKSVGYEYDHYSIIIPKEEPKQETNMNNITANQLIKDWKKTLESEWIQLDNLDEAKLVFDEKGNVVVENEHGTQFPVSDLSDVELDIFYTNLI
jgi:hypothetical protein